MFSASLIRHQVVQQGETIEECLLASVLMVKAFHHEQLAVHGVVRLVKHRTAYRHAEIIKHCIPPGFLVLEPLPHPLPVGLTRLTADGGGKVT
jgi:hypothetical protein